MKMVFTSAKRTTIFGWTRNAKVGEQEYAVSMQRGKSVRIPYKPRGKNRGFQWNGTVYRIGTNPGHVWAGRVPGSLGVRGILIEAGVLDEEENDGDRQGVTDENNKG